MQFHSSGTVIANRYEVAGRPLTGGMGIVYLCFDHQEQRPVALKTFKPEFLPDRAARGRFLEGNTWMRLGKHPNIVRAYGVERIGDGREVYLVLELVAKEEGRKDASLRAWLTPGKPLPVAQALLIALQIVRGMRHATDTIPGFVHRDLKPENVLVGADHLSNASINRVHVTDFGLIKGIRAEQVAQAQNGNDWASQPSQLTRVGVVSDTHYMAPEQWESAGVDVRADIYALGCILGELVTGRQLVQGGALDALRRKHHNGQAIANAGNIPDTLRDILAGCLAVDPDQRYGDWSAVESAMATSCMGVTNWPVPQAELGGSLTIADRIAAGWAFSMLGVSYLDMGNAQAALPYFERARKSGQVEGERALETAGLGNLGIALSNRGNVRHAIELFMQALAISREINDLRGEGTGLSNLGNAYARVGDAKRAIAFHEQSLAVSRKLGNLYGETAELNNLGSRYLHLGDVHRAMGFFTQALAVARESGDRRGESIILGNLGTVCSQLGDVQQAMGLHEQGLAISREIGDIQGEANRLCELGAVFLTVKDARRAIPYIEKALDICHEIGDRQGEGSNLGNLGIAYKTLGDAHRAISYSEQALHIDREIGNRRGESQDLCNLGNAYSQLGDDEESISFFEQAWVVSQEVSDFRTEAMVIANLAMSKARIGQINEAISLLHQAIGKFEQSGYQQHAMQAQRILFEIQNNR